MDNKIIIEKYFQSWVDQEISIIEDYFAEDITYIECYGPIYNGRSQCISWFLDWNKKGKVLKWEIHNIFQDNNYFIVEWFFECEFEGHVDSFDGVSIIKFRDDKVVLVKEFQSINQHYFPYGEKQYEK